MPARFGAVSRHLAHEMAASGRWLVTSREHTNFTYDLTARNLRHLAHWVADVIGCQSGFDQCGLDSVTFPSRKWNRE